MRPESNTLPSDARMLVIGGGQAGLSICETLRKAGHAGPLALVCGEEHLPYQRPPLSKAFLAGALDRDRLLLRPREFYRQQEIELHPGTACRQIDRQAKRVRLADGTELPWDRLALATGCRPRPLPGADGGAAPAALLRSLGDAETLAGRLAAARRLLVVGGGYIGLEVAATARMRGLEVVVLEAAPRLLARVAGPETAERVRRLHVEHGVAIRTGAVLESITGDGRGPGGICAGLADGSRIEADLAVAGIGAIPDTDLAAAAGLAIEDGIRVDAHCRSSDPHIFAAGDCASFPFRGRRIRLESVQNAIDQGRAAAHAMLGQDQPYRPTPWFWSDQYDAHLQIAGLSAGADATVIRPGPRPGAVSIWYFAGRDLLAVDALDDPRPYMIGKRLLESGRHPDPARVADPATNLKSLLR